MKTISEPYGELKHYILSSLERECYITELVPEEMGWKDVVVIADEIMPSCFSPKATNNRDIMNTASIPRVMW
jgi:hypothetical protein